MTGSRSSIMRRSGLLYGTMGFFIALFFQNCDGGFHYNMETGALSSAGGGNSGVGGTQFRLTTFNSAGIVVSEGQSLEGGIEYRVVASGQNLGSTTILWQLLNNTGGCVLRAGTSPEVRFVQCNTAGQVSIQSSAIWEDGSTTVLVSDRTTSPLIVDACGVSSTTRVVFRIPNGTGVAAWNSTNSPVVVFVGQTLRVCNDDATMHQMRTLGSPCASQPAPMARGAFYDCSVANVMNISAMTGVYNGIFDQIAGANAAFYVRGFDGRALYADTTKTSNGQSCVSCHGAFANSEKRGSSFTGIRNAITNNSGGMGIYAGRLTDDEIRAMAFSLNQ